jgi:serine/threonine-protein kinase PknK
LSRARIENSLGLLHQRRSAFQQAAERYGAALEMAKELHHLPFQATFAMNHAACQQQQGHLVEALTSYRRSLELARQIGSVREQAQIEQNLGRLLLQLGQLPAATRHVRRAAELAPQAQLRAIEGYSWIVEGEIALERQPPDFPAAAKLLATCQERFAELGDSVGQLDTQLLAARLALAQGEAADALGRCTALSDSPGALASQRITADLLGGRAELALGRDGLFRLRRGLRLAEDTNELEPLPALHHCLAQALAAQGDLVGEALHRDAARKLLRKQLDRLPLELQSTFLHTGERRAILTEGVPTDSARSKAEPADASVPTARLLSAILAINKELNQERDLDRMLERIVDHAVELSSAERGFLLLRPPGKEALTIRVARNIDQETIRKASFRLSSSIAERVVESAKALLTIDAMEDQRFRSFFSVHDLRLRSVLCVPIAIERSLRGALYLDNRFARDAFAQRELELMSAFADQAAIAIGNFELQQRSHEKQQELEQSQAELAAVNAELARALEQQRAALGSLQTSPSEPTATRQRFGKLVGTSRAMERIFTAMARIQQSDVSVLILGESGTGKEVVARSLHDAGPRHDGAFVAVNCGALPENLLESELFGYVKGAFTGADRHRRGVLERADGGTLFLDEVGEMPPALQVRLLRALQERCFTRVGDEKEISSDFRLISATNRDLRQMVREKAFREDLYYRINVVQLDLPPLRQRSEDVLLLTRHVLERQGLPKVQLHPAAARALLRYRWPGNVRELENELARVLALKGVAGDPEQLGEGIEINLEDLAPRIQETRTGGPSWLSLGDLPTLRGAVARLEQQLAKRALELCDGNVTEAAAKLGLSRVGLHKLMRRHNVERPRIRRKA